MRWRAKLFGIIIILLSSLLSIAIINAIQTNNSDWSCDGEETSNCVPIFEFFVVLLFIPITSYAFFFDGNGRTEFRNILAIFFIFYITLVFSFTVHILFFITLISSLAAFDGGKNTGIMTNPRRISDLAMRSSDIVKSQNTQTYRKHKNFVKHIKLDGWIGIGLISTTSFSLSLNIDFIKSGWFEIVFTNLDIGQVATLIQNFSLLFSFMFVIYRSSYMISEIILKNRFIMSIPPYRWLLSKFYFLFYLFIIAFALVFGIIVYIVFYFFISYQILYVLGESIMLMFWGLGFLLNS